MMQKPNYSKVHEAVKLTLIECRIQSMPINPFELLDELKIPYISFTEAARFSQFLPTICDLRNDRVDAYCVKKGAEYIIFYDDEVIYSDRLPFTLAHELGHIRLGHFDADFNSALRRFTAVRKRDYREIEADEFAGELLAPTAIAYLTELKLPEDISRSFGVSHSCADVVLKKLQRFAPQRLNREINFYKSYFSDYVNSRYCPRCNAIFNSESHRFCPLCDSEDTLWANFDLTVFNSYRYNGEIPVVNYKTYPINTLTCKVSECPRCGNLHNAKEQWNYCPICGLPTANSCSSCGAILLPHYRFCTDCGQESIFFQEDALERWNVEKAKLVLKDEMGANELTF